MAINTTFRGAVIVVPMVYVEADGFCPVGWENALGSEAYRGLPAPMEGLVSSLQGAKELAAGDARARLEKGFAIGMNSSLGNTSANSFSQGSGVVFIVCVA